MKSLAESLRGKFVIVNLGAAGDRDYLLPPELLAAATLVEIDAGKSSRSAGAYFARHSLRAVVSGTKGTQTFRRRRYALCSSLLEPRAELVELYGLGTSFDVVSESQVDCEPLPALLNELGIQSIDFLKTDLEGLDYDVIRSCEAFLPQILAIQCELRFQPFYIGEPHFHEVASYLAEHGFELIALKPEYWKPRTAHSRKHRDGRLVWADCLFMRKVDSVMRLPDPARASAAARQIIIASMVGRRCYGEHLLDRYRKSLPERWIADLAPLGMPHRPLRETWIWKLLRRIRNKVRRPKFDLSHVAEG